MDNSLSIRFNLSLYFEIVTDPWKYMARQKMMMQPEKKLHNSAPSYSTQSQSIILAQYSWAAVRESKPTTLHDYSYLGSYLLPVMLADLSWAVLGDAVSAAPLSSNTGGSTVHTEIWSELNALNHIFTYPIINRLIVSTLHNKYQFLVPFANFMWHPICCQTTAIHQAEANCWSFSSIWYSQEQIITLSYHHSPSETAIFT